MLPPGEFFSNIFIVSIVLIVAIIPIFLIDNLAVAMQSSRHSYAIASSLLCHRIAVAMPSRCRCYAIAVPFHMSWRCDYNVVAVGWQFRRAMITMSSQHDDYAMAA